VTRSHHRIERINAIVKEVLSELVLREIKDPRVGLVTIVTVRTAPDFSSARVYFSVMGDAEQREATLKILRGASRYFRHVISDELGVRTSPELIWEYDDSLDRAFRIAEILKEAENPTPAADAPADPPADPEKEPGA